MKNKSIQFIMLLVLMFAVVFILLDGEQMLTRRINVIPTRVQIVPVFENVGYPGPVDPTPTLGGYVAPPTSTPYPTKTPYVLPTSPEPTPTQNPDI